MKETGRIDEKGSSMRKQLAVIYDDTRKPGRDISSITGKKGFGDIIYKRLTLRERSREYFESLNECEIFADASEVAEIKINNNTPVILIYSDFVIRDKKGVEILITKALCAHENYLIVDNNKNAGVIFKDYESFTKACVADFDNYAMIQSDSFLDISEVNAFRAFITGGFEARFFNSVSGDEYTVVKTSDKVSKIKAEYTFYGLLPDDMKQWFVCPYNYQEKDGKASYTMERYHMTDLAIRYIHGAIGTEEFRDIIEKLFYFLGKRHTKPVSKEEYDTTARKIYIEKVEERTEELKKVAGYDKLAELIKALTPYSSIDEIVARYKELYVKVRKNGQFDYVKAIGHGDLCFSNILYSKEASLLKLIDPKGALMAEDLYMDPYYDLAKLSHSICGHYDYYNSDLFEISVGSDLNARLKVDADNRIYVQQFKQKLEENNIDFRIVRLYEASLFLSMLPFHMDRPKKVFAFVLNALAIMDSLES